VRQYFANACIRILAQGDSHEGVACSNDLFPTISSAQIKRVGSSILLCSSDVGILSENRVFVKKESLKNNIKMPFASSCFHR